jgi:hypothetical protein
LTGLWPQVQRPLLHLCQHSPIDAGEALSRNLGPKFCPQLQIGLRAKLQRDELLRPQPHPVGDVVLGDDQVLAEIIATADEHMAVRMPGVEVIDRDPVQLRAEVLLHLPHHVAGKGTQVGKLLGVLRSDDEPELVAVLPAAFDEGLTVGFIDGSAVEPAALAVARGAVALQVAEVGVGGATACLQPHDPRLHHDPAHPRAPPMLTGYQLEPVGNRLAAAHPRTFSPPGPSPRIPPRLRSARRAELRRSAVGLGGRSHRLREERPQAPVSAGATIAHTSQPRRKSEASVMLARLRPRIRDSSLDHDTSCHGVEKPALCGEAHIASLNQI